MTDFAYRNSQIDSDLLSTLNHHLFHSVESLFASGKLGNVSLPLARRRIAGKGRVELEGEEPDLWVEKPVGTAGRGVWRGSECALKLAETDVAEWADGLEEWFERPGESAREQRQERRWLR